MRPHNVRIKYEYGEQLKITIVL